MGYTRSRHARCIRVSTANVVSSDRRRRDTARDGNVPAQLTVIMIVAEFLGKVCDLEGVGDDRRRRVLLGGRDRWCTIV